MSSKTILAIDQGTTSSRAILFDQNAHILDIKQKELTLHYPQKGWVEQDANDIWEDTLRVCREIIKNTASENIAAIGITNQRETTIIWDRKTGKPVYNAIVWQDRRTAKMCETLRDGGHEDMVAEKTGLRLDPYFSATKIAWILDHVDGARTRAEKGELAFGTVDSWLLWNLTGGTTHATDVTNASRTALYNIQTLAWDEELLELFDIPRSLLPQVHENVADFGVCKPDILGASLPVCGIAGDQQAAFIGQACFEKGMIKSTYGTGCFALMNIGAQFRLSENRLLTTIGYVYEGKVTYALEGSIFIAGAAIQWLRDNLGLFKTADESEDLARSVPDNNGVYFVPAFTGLGAPYWDPHARAAIIGLTRESNAAHITRAALEAQAYQTRDLLNAMIADSGETPQVIRADGGLVTNKFMCQFTADMLQCPLEIPQITETTALGAAYLAGLGAGLYKDMDDIAARWHKAAQYDVKASQESVDDLYQGWQSAVSGVLAQNH
jgi:glycerol kinase